tara:strand:+ start:1005 stop:1880 length:876 start_codon:yes stop_codon:yes gene_type:complete
MLATEILRGQGIGNQLFCYVTARSIAHTRGLEFGVKDTGWSGDKRYNQSGFYWFDLDWGQEVPDGLDVYYEKEVRKKLNTCHHDMTVGCDVRGYDQGLMDVPDNTIIFGNMQDEKYFDHNKELVKEWLKVKEEYDTYEYMDDDVCVLNYRGGEYVGFHELYLTREYWLNAMENMTKINPNMKFVTITDDVKASQAMLPEIPAYHFTVDKDYAIIKNSKHVILSNSSFPFFAVYTSDTIENIIAPKYWARHNVSDGYWAMSQNIYSGWTYQDRDGNLSTAEECVKELEKYNG